MSNLLAGLQKANVSCYKEIDEDKKKSGFSPKPLAKHLLSEGKKCEFHLNAYAKFCEEEKARKVAKT